MAGVNWSTNVEVTTGTATLTLLQIIAAANRRVRINRVTVSGKGLLNTDAPVTVEVLEQTSAGTTGGSATVSKNNPGDAETLGVTAAITFSSTEPTTGGIRASRNIHPQASAEFTFPQGVRDLFVGGSAAARLGIRVVSPSQSSTFRVTVEGEE